MKKFKCWGLLITLLLVLTGCKEKTTPQEIDKLPLAINKMQEVKSFSLKMTADLNAKIDGEEQSFTLTANGDVSAPDEDHFKMHMTISGSNLGTTDSMETYVTKEKKQMYTYVKEDDSWKYVVADDTEEVNSILNMAHFEDDSFFNVREVTSDREGYTKITASISREGLNTLLDGMSSSIDGMLANLISTQAIEVSIYLKDDYIAIIEMDLSDLLKTFYDLTTDSDTSVSYKMVVEYSNYNNVSDITIPEEVKKSAQKIDLNDQSKD